MAGARHSDLLRSRIGRRLVGLFLVTSLVPVLALAAFAVTQITSSLQGDTQRKLREVAKTVGLALLDRLYLMRDRLDELGHMIAAGTSPPVLSDPLRESLSTSFEWIALADPNGLPPIPVLGVPTSVPGLDDSHVAHLKRGRWQLIEGASEGGSRVVLVRSFESIILMARVRSHELFNGAAFLSHGSELLVLGPDGGVLHTTAAGRALGSLETAVAASPRAGQFEWEQGGKDYSGGFSRLFLKHEFNTNWVVAYSQLRDDLYSSYFDFRRFFLLVVALAFGLSMLVSLSQIRRILKPVLGLKHASRVVASGNLDIELTPGSSDELGELTSAFGMMVARLKENVAYRDRVEQDLTTMRDEALRAARTETNFLQNVSHEMRTPLTSVRAFAEILINFDDDPDTRREFLRIILAESERLTRLIDNVLDLSKIQSGRIEWRREASDLRPIVRRVSRVLEPLARDAGVRIVVDLPEEPIILDIDVDRIEQALLNIAGNAVKFSAKGGRVTLCARSADDTVEVVVRDQGCGIPRSQHESVFERFHQVSEDLVTEKPSGTGLGLPISREIVERHGGRIELESAPGEGACFRIVLPRPDEGSPSTSRERDCVGSSR